MTADPGPRVTVAFPPGRGAAQWRRRHAEGLVPNRWPYGLDGLEADGVRLDEVELGRPRAVDRVLARLGRAGGALVRRPRVPGALLTWDEQTAVRRARAVDADSTWSGVIWATDRLARGEDPRELAAVREALLRSDGLWCLSRPQADAVERWLGPAAPPTGFLRFGIDEAFYAPAPYPERPLVASVGGDRDRDAVTLFAALEEVVARMPGVRCVVQSGSSVPAPPGVEVVAHLPHVEVRELYARASVVAVATRPNLHVSGMTVSLEAMSTGRPVVLSDHPGVGDYVADGRTGLLARPGDPGAMADRILDLLDDPAAAAAMGGRGRAAVEERFTTRAMCGALRAMVLGRSGPAEPADLAEPLGQRRHQEQGGAGQERSVGDPEADRPGQQGEHEAEQAVVRRHHDQ